ncbi:hypothetical protein [Sphingomonas jatrophae]|uniref:Uncharacterized protein n=1 Tax=Sphingomonas jatrophae TaxID=1166337 RepID=A0A1I6L1E8_9SPHN|nr:hypothetical protein [Sphingomonas jatrophae]SFR97275.1 hypothetical protein SAMN05192580_2145 [Sphingomonas jatrophae]
MALPIKYPDELKNSNWQKKKGLVAKIATSGDAGTGIGKLLIALEAAWGKIKWDQLGFDQVMKGVGRTSVGEDHIKEYVKVVNGEISKALPARKLAAAVETEAKKVAEGWAKDKLIPKSATAAAAGVSLAARDLAYAMAPGNFAEFMKEEVNAIRVAIKKNEAFKQQALQKVKPLVAKMLSEAAKVKQPEDWADFWKEYVRGVGTQMPLAAKAEPALDPLYRKFKAPAANQTNPKDDKEMKKRLNEVITLGKEIQAELR